jgi:hypothetical protein
MKQFLSVHMRTPYYCKGKVAIDEKNYIFKII